MKIKIQKQSGITLIELMIALLIGAIMLTGIIAVFVNSNKTNRVLTSLSRVQEDARFAMGTIKSSLNLAGYKQDARLDRTLVFPAFTTVSPTPIFTMASGQSIFGLDNQITTAGIQEDQIYFRYQDDGSGSTISCLGESFPLVLNGNTIGNHYYIADKGQGKNLYCDSLLLSDPAAVIQSQPLVPNVEKFQILYGMSTDNVPGSMSVSCYLPANNISTTTVTDCASGLNFKQVLIVRINMIISTEAKNLTYDNNKHDFTYAGMTVIDDDKKLYRGFTLDIELNNHIL